MKKVNLTGHVWQIQRYLKEFNRKKGTPGISLKKEKLWSEIIECWNSMAKRYSRYRVMEEYMLGKLVLRPLSSSNKLLLFKN